MTVRPGRRDGQQTRKSPASRNWPASWPRGLCNQSGSWARVRQSCPLHSSDSYWQGRRGHRLVRDQRDVCHPRFCRWVGRSAPDRQAERSAQSRVRRKSNYIVLTNTALADTVSTKQLKGEGCTRSRQRCNCCRDWVRSRPRRGAVPCSWGARVIVNDPGVTWDRDASDERSPTRWSTRSAPQGKWP
jgi:hypothetical protein